MANTLQSPRYTQWPQVGPARYHGHSISSASEYKYGGRRHLRDHRNDDEPKLGSTVRVFAEKPRPAPDQDLRTRNLSIIGLCLGWVTSIASIATGIYVIASPPIPTPTFLLDKIVMIGSVSFTWMHEADPTFENLYLGGHRVYNLDESAMLLLPLIIQLIIAVIFGCMSSIHATTLRWALWQEGSLFHNSNLRLFMSSKRNGPNKWPANVVACTGLILAYASTSIMTFPVSVVGILDMTREDPVVYDLASVGPNRYGLDFNGWGLLGLGIGLLLQATISTWALLSSPSVGTWSPHPLATARACHHLAQTTNHDRSPTPTFPAFTQPSALALIPTVRRLANTLWAISLLIITLLLTISIISTRLGTNTLSSITSNFGPPTPWSTFQFYGLVSITYNRDPFSPSRNEYIGLLIQCLVLTIPLLGLHVAELLAQLVRDEKIWRRASTFGISQTGLVSENLRNWPTCVVFVYSFVVPWVFSFAVSCNRDIYLATLPTVVLAVLFLGLAGFGEWLIRWRPAGAQPAVYGDLRVLVGLVDEWEHERLFWGDKGELGGRVRAAGTAGQRLADVREGVLYRGLSTEVRGPQGEAGLGGR
ncbi:hypothetical protein OQA88_13111 [Cercophora sp. LCS_1]